jgi:hypothetical protein
MKLELRAVFAAAAIAAGCSSTPAPFPIAADPEARSLLTGEWAGTYSGVESGRSGSIVFTLETGDSAVTTRDGEHAHGDVLMIPTGATAPIRQVDGADPTPGGDPSVLSIQFVRATGNHVMGTLAPYYDPACRCTVSTTFMGDIAGDRITGVFSAVGPNDYRQTGTWEVRRRSP